MRFVALVSGGKDSIYSILQAVRNGHELVACIHLGAPISDNGNAEIEQEESYMYQTAASEVVKTMVEECLGVELLLYPRRGRSVNTGLVYENTTPDDEVEDLFVALKHATTQFVFEGVCSGAILSTYQRVRIEHVCTRLGLTSLSFLWRLAPQNELLRKMLDDGIEAVLVKVACPPGLVPRKHLNKTLRFLSDIGLLERLNNLYQFQVCGEGGEYESLVIDSPLYKKKLVLDEVEIIESNTGDGVGELRILSCHAGDKGDGDIPMLKHLDLENQEQEKCEVTGASINIGLPVNKDNEPKSTSVNRTEITSVSYLPHVYQGTGGLLHFSEIISPVVATSPMGSKSEAELAVEEAKLIFTILKKGLRFYGANATDVFYVHLYLSEISHFDLINAHYQKVFGSILPPSRSCVALGRGVLPGGRRVLLDCKVQIGSGEFLRSSTNSAPETLNPYAESAFKNRTSKLREVLHVQSISRWAPVCVGPYSQVNSLRSGLQFLAGQIGLIPETMTLQPSWTSQLEQCWKNIASVLDAMNGGSLKEIFGSLIYLSDTISTDPKVMGSLETISRSQFQTNGSIIPGRIDSPNGESELYGGYEDQETWEEMKSQEEMSPQEEFCNKCPILVVSIPEMPKEALVEVEVITSSVGISKYLDTKNHRCTMECSRRVSHPIRNSVGWESGHDFHTTLCSNEGIHIDSFAHVVGERCAASVLVTASCLNVISESYVIHSDFVLSDMLSSAEKVLYETRAGLGYCNFVHVRLFHVSSEKLIGGGYVVHDDGVQLRASLRNAVGSKFERNPPATSVVSVKAINTISIMPEKLYNVERKTVFAMQVLLIDPVHLETEIWINKDR